MTLSTFFLAFGLIAMLFLVKLIAKHVPALGLLGGLVLLLGPAVFFFVIGFFADLGSKAGIFLGLILFGVIGVVSYGLGAQLLNTSVRALRGEEVDPLKEAAHAVGRGFRPERQDIEPEEPATPAIGWLIRGSGILLLLGMLLLAAKCAAR